MTRRILTVLALAVLTGFLAVMVLKLQRLDLSALVLLTLGLAAWDVLFPARGG